MEHGGGAVGELVEGLVEQPLLKPVGAQVKRKGMSDVLGGPHRRQFTADPFGLLDGGLQALPLGLGLGAGHGDRLADGAAPCDDAGVGAPPLDLGGELGMLATDAAGLVGGGGGGSLDFGSL